MACQKSKSDNTPEVSDAQVTSFALGKSAGIVNGDDNNKDEDDNRLDVHKNSAANTEKSSGMTPDDYDVDEFFCLDQSDYDNLSEYDDSDVVNVTNTVQTPNKVQTVTDKVQIVSRHLQGAPCWQQFVVALWSQSTHPSHPSTLSEHKS
jgi:hypothetical protein